ncbi:MAG: nuclear transport factor 2 family protein [Pyrinomonadaceae bacterium]|nr:nuclear transport factor 2 family protein [Phycisphaerales bacterium]
MLLPVRPTWTAPPLDLLPVNLPHRRTPLTLLSLLVSTFLQLISPCLAQPDTATAERTLAVSKVLDDWHDAAAKADEKRYFDHFAPGAIFMGTDATERWNVQEFRAYAKPHFDKGKAWSFTPHDRHVMFAADARTAWFDEQLDTPNLGPSRGSGVLALLGGAWKIAHYNLTIPVPNDLAGDIVKQIATYHKSASPTLTGFPAGSIALNVLTFNIRYNNPGDGADAWPNRRTMASELIRAGAYDVVGLQEALHPQLQELLADLPEFASIGVGRDDGKEKGEYAAILYRRDRFKLADSGTFWLSDTPEVPGSKSWGNNITRICTWARLTEKPASSTTTTDPATPPHAPASFYIYNVHLDHESQPSREKSVWLLLGHIARRATKDQVVWTGDFNAGEANPAVANVKGEVAPGNKAEGFEPSLERAALPVFVDSFRLRFPDERTVGTFNAFKGLAGGDKIDYIFVPRETRTLEAIINRTSKDGRYPSDHFPVSAKFVLPAGRDEK